MYPSTSLTRSAWASWRQEWTLGPPSHAVLLLRSVVPGLFDREMIPDREQVSSKSRMVTFTFTFTFTFICHPSSKSSQVKSSQLTCLVQIQ